MWGVSGSIWDSSIRAQDQRGKGSPPAASGTSCCQPQLHTPFTDPRTPMIRRTSKRQHPLNTHLCAACSQLLQADPEAGPLGPQKLPVSALNTGEDLGVERVWGECGKGTKAGVDATSIDQDCRICANVHFVWQHHWLEACPRYLNEVQDLGGGQRAPLSDQADSAIDALAVHVYGHYDLAGVGGVKKVWLCKCLDTMMALSR